MDTPPPILLVRFLLVRFPAAGAGGELRTGILHLVTILPREPQKSDS
jgi:hypothetical protein